MPTTRWPSEFSSLLTQLPSPGSASSPTLATLPSDSSQASFSIGDFFLQDHHLNTFNQTDPLSAQFPLFLLLQTSSPHPLSDIFTFPLFLPREWVAQAGSEGGTVIQVSSGRITDYQSASCNACKDKDAEILYISKPGDPSVLPMTQPHISEQTQPA